MGNVLAWERRVAVVCHLVEGASVNATARMTGVSKPTILSLLLQSGEGCDRIHDRRVHSLCIREVELDELWSFIQKKQRRVGPADPPHWGDAYAFLAMARTQKLLIAYRVGKRDEQNTRAFVADLRSRLAVVPAITSDGFTAYPTAVGESFAIDGQAGAAVDYVVLLKEFNGRRFKDDSVRYEPPRDPVMHKRGVFGAPDIDRASTSHIERANLTVRMHIRRFTRLCNGYSKSLPHHKAAVSLHVAFYNFCRVHETLRVTPAMEAGLTDHVWTVDELLREALGAPVQEKPKVRPLRLPETGTAKELPGGRGWLRAVPSTGKAGASAGAPTPPRPPEAPAVRAAPAPKRRWVQMDLFGWKPPEK
ncbi:IS1 family transposase [Polyangium spumosum]|uniref:IS1 family transposase n=1 Tax=Polyangium spumosum TaxID=889282 RepID=A0A6N7PHR5_9BACT|nr:IS1 family transposase [Polyangium spumosum]MRG91662.1 IS1 family transposase [Polyangium spumosum]